MEIRREHSTEWKLGKYNCRGESAYYTEDNDTCSFMLKRVHDIFRISSSSSSKCGVTMAPSKSSRDVGMVPPITYLNGKTNQWKKV